MAARMPCAASAYLSLTPTGFINRANAKAKWYTDVP